MTKSIFSISERLGIVEEQETKKVEMSEIFYEVNIALRDKPNEGSYRKIQVNTKNLDTINLHFKDYEDRYIVK